MHCLLFGFIAISVHAFVVMFMHQLGVPQPMQDAAAPAWRSASRKAESRHPQSRTMEVPPVGRKVETLDESTHARERDDFAALRKDMRQLISRLSQHLDHVEQPKTAPRAAAAETPAAAAAAREPEPVQSAAGVAATLRTDKVGLALAEAVQAMARDAMLAEDAGRTEGGMERPATAAASLQPRLEQLTARLARAEAEARELGELQARAEAELREVEAAAADRRRAQRRAQGQAEAAASAAAGATDSASGAAGAAGAAGTTLEQLLETLRAQRPAASPKPTAAAAEPAAAQPAAAKPLSAKPAAAAPRRKPKKEKEDNWEDEWEKEDQEASSVESSHTSLTAEVQAMLAKLMGGGGGGGGSRGESKASAKKKKGRKVEHEQPKGERVAQEDRAAAAREQTGAKGQAASRARADKDDFEVHDLD